MKLVDCQRYATESLVAFSAGMQDDGPKDGYAISSEVHFPVYFRATTEDVETFNYFEESAYTASGLPMYPVDYQRTKLSPHHHYNPVTHFKLEGVLTQNDELALQVPADFSARINNHRTGSGRHCVIPLYPGCHEHSVIHHSWIAEHDNKRHYIRQYIDIKCSDIKMVYNGTPHRKKVPCMIIQYALCDAAGSKETISFVGQHGCIAVTSGFSWLTSDIQINEDYVGMIGKSDVMYRAIDEKLTSWNKLVGDVCRQSSVDRLNLIPLYDTMSPGPYDWPRNRFVNAGSQRPYWNIDGSSTRFRLQGCHYDALNKSTKAKSRISLVQDLSFDSLNELTKTPPGLWNELSFEALQNLGDADVNGIAYVKDAIELGPTVKAFIRVLKSVPTKKIKAVAAAWLAIHYGFKLTVLDTKSLYDELHKEDQFGLSNARSMRETVLENGAFATYRYQIIYDRFRNLYDTLDGFLHKVDFTVSLENVWDMVPFSFVIDWFVSIGDMFNALDNYYNVRSYYTTAAAGQSIKIKGSLSSDDPLLGGGYLQYSLYKRAYKEKPEAPVPRWNTVTVGPQHWLEGAALIIANAR